MAVSSGGKAEISVPQKWHDMKDSSNYERSKGVIEAKAKKAEQKVAVIYYLSRNGQLEHPHFMVVPLSSPQGLYLKDVINRLTSLRGQGIASMYSWSSKRSYKNGFVWHDLSEDDLIQPCQGHEYVLKGSQILESSLSFRSFESTGSSFSSSSSSMFSRETNSPGEEHLTCLPTTAITRRKNQSCGSFDDLREYQVHRPKTAVELSKATDASTQTEGKARQRKTSLAEIREPEIEGCGAENARECGRTKASTVLMDLIKCGSRGIKDCDSIKRKD